MNSEERYIAACLHLTKRCVCSLVPYRVSSNMKIATVVVPAGLVVMASAFSIVSSLNAFSEVNALRKME